MGAGARALWRTKGCCGWAFTICGARARSCSSTTSAATPLETSVPLHESTMRMRPAGTTAGLVRKVLCEATESAPCEQVGRGTKAELLRRASRCAQRTRGMLAQVVGQGEAELQRPVVLLAASTGHHNIDAQRSASLGGLCRCSARVRRGRVA